MGEGMKNQDGKYLGGSKVSNQVFGLDTWSVWLGWVEAMAISRTTKHASNQMMQFDKT